MTETSPLRLDFTVKVDMSGTKLYRNDKALVQSSTTQNNIYSNKDSHKNLNYLIKQIMLTHYIYFGSTVNLVTQEPSSYELTKL